MAERQDILRMKIKEALHINLEKNFNRDIGRDSRLLVTGDCPKKGDENSRKRALLNFMRESFGQPHHVSRTCLCSCIADQT